MNSSSRKKEEESILLFNKNRTNLSNFYHNYMAFRSKMVII